MLSLYMKLIWSLILLTRTRGRYFDVFIVRISWVYQSYTWFKTIMIYDVWQQFNKFLLIIWFDYWKLEHTIIIGWPILFTRTHPPIPYSHIAHGSCFFCIVWKWSTHAYFLRRFTYKQNKSMIFCCLACIYVSKYGIPDISRWLCNQSRQTIAAIESSISCNKCCFDFQFYVAFGIVVNMFCFGKN